MSNGLEIRVVPGEGVELHPTETVIELVSEGVQGPVGPPGPPGGAFFVHTQSTPAATWTINHNLGRRPGVSLLTVGGVEFEGQVVHINTNQAQALLVAPFAGQALCI